MFKKIKRLIRKKKRPVPKFEGNSTPKTNRIERKRNRRNLQLFALFLCLIGLLGAYGLFRTFMQEERPQEESVEAIVFTSFKNQVENSTPKQLVDLYLDSKENPLASLPERIDHFKKKNQIAIRLASSDEGQLRDFGSAACFELLARRDSLLLMHGLLDLKTDGENVCSRYLDELSDLDGIVRSGADSAKSILMSRQLAVLLGEYFTAFSNSQKVDEPFLELYANTTKQCARNERLVKILFDVAMHAFKNNASDKPLESFIAQFDSKPIGNDLAVYGADRLAQREFATINDSFYDAKSSGMVDKVFESVKSNISKIDLPTELSSRLDRINDFSKLGEAERGNDLLKLLEPKISDANSRRLRKRYDRLLARFKNFDTAFSLDGIRSLNNEAAAFRSPNSQMKVILVGNTKTRVESQQMLKEGIRINRNNSNKLSLAFLVHNVGGQTNGMKQLKQISEKILDVDFWTVSDETEDGRAFLKKLPLDDAPFFIVLDNNNHPVSIGSNATMVEEIVSQIR